MKTILEYLFSKKSDLDKIGTNRFGITEKDLIGELEGFPIGVVVRMLEEQENQRNKPDVKVFQKCNHMGYTGGFQWEETVAGRGFWARVIECMDFKEFYKRYPEYKKYDL